MPTNQPWAHLRVGQLWLIPLAATLVWAGCERKLSHYQKKSARAALGKLEKVEIKLTDTEKKLQALIDEDAAFMKKAKTVKKAQSKLAKLRAEMKALKAKGRKIAKILDKDKGKDRSKLQRLTRELKASLNKTRLKLALLIKPVRTLRHAKKNAKRLIRQVKATRSSIKSYPPAPVAKRVEQASKKYPKAKEDIERRVKALKGGSLLTLADAFDTAAKKNPPDYLAMGRLASQIQSRRSQLDHDRKQLLTHIDELDDHVDLVLIDMKEERGRFYHRYLSVRGRKWRRTGWKPVSATLFRRHTDHLGMALYAKPKGTFHTKALTIASPPGYVYVGHDEYGKWKEEGGEKRWRFKPKYNYMMALFFAGTAAVTYAAYHSFRKARMRRMVWFGMAGALWYGTRSARMKRKYKGYYSRKARKARMRRARRSRTRRYGRRSRRGK